MAQGEQKIRLKFTDDEAKTANATRGMLLQLFRQNQQAGLSPEDPDTQALMERYRREYIDIYLFTSTPIQIFAMGTALAVDPHNQKECDRYGEGLAAYLSQAMLAYYKQQKETE
ncbi:MAG: TipAS antibiotic-recognition domain-containing protein [Firmicutes bacterium]|nr:TipAS antibiotic-recognition domain-containing protein [Bacillota bacterium]